MLLIDKPTTCLNWQFIDKEKFPEQFDNSNVKEDFELLFQQHFDAVRLKELLRHSTRDPNQAARKFLWKRILLQDSAQMQITIEKYNTKISVLFGKNLTLKAELPVFVSYDHLSFYYLNEEGKAAVCRVLNVLASAHPDITYAPLLLPLSSLFLHYMSEPECYACLLAVVESKNIMVTQTDIHWTTTNLVFRRFAQKYSRTSYQYVLNALYSKTKDSETSLDALDNWQWWIFEHLPFNYVLNIVDCFLLEGQKVLYRYGICLLEFFYKSFGSHSRPGSLNVDAIENFCKKISVSQEHLLKGAFGLRNMRRKDLEIVFQAEEKSIKKIRAKTNEKVSLNYSMQSGLSLNEKKANQQMNNINNNNNNNNSKSNSIKSNTKKQTKQDDISYSCSLIPKRKSNLNKENNTYIVSDENSISNNKKPATSDETNANLNMSDQKLRKWQTALKTIGISKKWKLNASKALQSHLSYHHFQPQSHMNLPTFSVENTGSTILSAQQIAQIWRWLPNRYQILELQCIYSTNIHGCRLMTLFDKIEYYDCTILIVQTMKGSVFGAFCSQPWSNRISNSRYRKPSFFGNGESFLFELKPDVDLYQWVGKERNGNTNANQEQFQYADNEKLIVGGGNTARNSVVSVGKSSTIAPAPMERREIKFSTEVDSSDDEDNEKKRQQQAMIEQVRGMGLVIDADLLRGRSAVSDTFENKVLGDELEFEIAVLEVLSFNGGLNNF